MEYAQSSIKFPQWHHHLHYFHIPIFNPSRIHVWVMYSYLYLFLSIIIYKPKMNIPFWRQACPISQNLIHSNSSRGAWTSRAAFSSFPDLEPIYIALCRSLPTNTWSEVVWAPSSMEEYIFLRVHRGTPCVVCYGWIYRYPAALQKKTRLYL